MKELSGQRIGDLRLDQDAEVGGQQVGTLTVSGGVVVLRGQVTENLVIEPGGEAHLRGQVSGDVTNAGGRLVVYGMIVGRLFEQAGETIVDPAAEILQKG